MQLFLVRHAIAAVAEPGQPDEARPLTAEGRDRFAREVRTLAGAGLLLDRIYHSPMLRAVETADLLASLLDDGGELVTLPALAAPPRAALLERLEGERVALVGHEPWTSALLALLLHGNTKSAARYAVKKGGIAWLEGEPRAGQMKLRALLPPALLRR